MSGLESGVYDGHEPGSLLGCCAPSLLLSQRTELKDGSSQTNSSES